MRLAFFDHGLDSAGHPRATVRLVATDDEQPYKIPFRLVEERTLPYTRVDIFQVSRLDRTFAVTGFQIHYQQVATTMAQLPPGTGPSEPLPAHLVTRLVMDEEGFRRLRDEVNQIFDKAGLK